MTHFLDTLRLLLIHDSQDESEQLLNVLRNSGQATRAERVADEESLLTQLKGNSWDLMICRPKIEECSADIALTHIKRLGKDIPSIVLIDEYDPGEILKYYELGASRVVVNGESRWTLLCAQQELAHLISRRKRQDLELDLHETEKRAELLLDTARDAVAYVVDGMHIYANEAYVELFGYSDPDDLAGMPIMDMVDSSSHSELKATLRALQQSDNQSTESLHCMCEHSSGEKFESDISFSPATYDDEACTQIVIKTGADDAELQERIQEMESRDLLTGLRNRSFFMTTVDEAVVKAVKHEQASSIIYIHLDNFSSVREQVGIGGGDTIQTDLAHLLEKHCGEGCVLSRFADDAFTFLIPESDIDKTSAKAEQLRAEVEQHMFEVQKKTISITLSIGVALINENAPNGQEAISRANEASNEARKNGGNQLVTHNPARYIDTNTDSGMAKVLQQAIEKNEFQLMYQAIISLQDDSDEFYQVLLQLPRDGSTLEPRDFMSAAAAAGLSGTIDRWVMLNSIKALAIHNGQNRKTRLLLTLTDASIKDEGLATWIAKALKAARLSGEMLAFQISENDANTYLKQVKQLTKQLHSLNCQICISRYGCALDSTKVLDHIDMDLIKLDGSYTQDISNNENKEKMTKIVADVRQKEKLIIAPYVESAAALQALWQTGVDFIQGFYIQAPSDKMDYDFIDED